MTVGRHRDQRDAGQLFAHEVELECRVIDEHEAVQSEIELGRDFAQIRDLVVPVYSLDGKIGVAQNHVRMVRQYVIDILRIILAAKCEQHAAPAQVEREALDIGKRRAVARFIAHAYAALAVFAEDAVPQRVVAVENEYLLSEPRSRQYRGCDIFRVAIQQDPRVRRAG